METKLYCDVCKREIAKTNAHGKIIDGKSMILCGRHYSQLMTKGRFLDANPFSQKERNPYTIEGNDIWIYSVNNDGQKTGKFVIDLQDLDQVISHKWRQHNGRYCTNIPQADGKIKSVYITQLLIPNVPKGFDIDHRDHCPWNNRRSNLRVITHAQNIKNQLLKTTNSSGIAGVWYDKSRDKWVAEIKYNEKKCQLGRYEQKSDACYARCFAEFVLFQAYRNFSNDAILLPIASASCNKSNIESHVLDRIWSIYIIKDQELLENSIELECIA